MKKLLLSLALVAFAFTANAQDGKFNLGANAALPIGNAGDLFSFGFGAEANYLFQVSDEFQVGPSVAYLSYSVDSAIGSGSVGIMPLTVAARYNASEDFTLGADLGYGIGVSNASGGDFYYRPMVGYNVSDNAMVQLSYNGMDGFDSVGLGVMFGL